MKAANSKGANMFQTSSDDIEKKLRMNLEKMPSQFKAVIAFAIKRVENHISLILNNANQKYDTDGPDEKINMRQKIQKTIRRDIAEWAAEWRVGEHNDIKFEQDIPELYRESSEYIDDADNDDDSDDEDDDDVVVVKQEVKEY
jgi:hypothetical protein